MILSLIAAMARNRVIGRDNDLPWRLPADFRRFKQLTMGHVLIVGRRTYESVGNPLPGRTFIVITRQLDYTPAGILVAHSLDEALAIARRQGGPDEVFVGGGAGIYAEALPRAHRLYLTRLDQDFAGDTFFPPFDEARWRLVSEEPHDAGDGADYPWRFQLYEQSQPATR